MKYNCAVIANAVKQKLKTITPVRVYFHFKNYSDYLFINEKGLFYAKGANQPNPYFTNVGYADFAKVLDPWSERGTPDTLKQLLQKAKLEYIEIPHRRGVEIFKTFEEFIDWLGLGG